MSAGRSSYTGSTRNGITSSSYGAWAGSFSFYPQCPAGQYAWPSNNRCYPCPEGQILQPDASGKLTCQARCTGLSAMKPASESLESKLEDLLDKHEFKEAYKAMKGSQHTWAIAEGDIPQYAMSAPRSSTLASSPPRGRRRPFPRRPTGVTTTRSS
jgi:hypothetical protein